MLTTSAPIPRDFVIHIQGDDPDDNPASLQSETDEIELLAVAAPYGWTLIPERFPAPGEYYLFWDDMGRFGPFEVVDAIDDVPPEPVEPADVRVRVRHPLPLFHPTEYREWLEVHWDEADTSDIEGWVVEVAADATFDAPSWSVASPTLACAGDVDSSSTCAEFDLPNGEEIWFRAMPIDAAGNLGQPTGPLRLRP